MHTIHTEDGRDIEVTKDVFEYVTGLLDSQIQLEGMQSALIGELDDLKIEVERMRKSLHSQDVGISEMKDRVHDYRELLLEALRR